ncbi:MAG: hypothetical protein Q8M31_08850 [Beijerinckiaceae bacterium]|nr:hypothetical protein [Beijerinckiaceae bacterium]
MDDPVSIGLRLPAAQARSLDAWIAAHPEPCPTRSEAIRRLLESALGTQRPPESLDQKIARTKRTIANNPLEGEPSAAQGMATLRRGLAETKLRSLKARNGAKPKATK